MSNVDDQSRQMADKLEEILSAVKSLRVEHETLSSTVEAISGRVNVLSDVKEVQPVDKRTTVVPPPKDTLQLGPIKSMVDFGPHLRSSASSPATTDHEDGVPTRSLSASPSKKQGPTSRIILTTYPDERSGGGIKKSQYDQKTQWWVIDKINIEAGERSVSVMADHPKADTISAIGAHGGSYAIYHALAVASNELNVDHRPDFTNTEPAVSLGPFPQWAQPRKIVSMDPLGHLAPWLFKDIIASENVDIRPTIAITKAHMKLPELEQSVRAGRLIPDGKICLNQEGELAVTKFAVEPVWYLPGVAERFGIDEGALRRSLFENTGGSYPELITRGDIKLFLPPIGGLTVYCFGDPSKMSDPNVRLALRVHDECNGSDVFGSDICTCRPYLIFGVEEAVKEAQKGGSGVVIYFRKEGRALGEVTKYLVYNARKRGSDQFAVGASEYFKRTENIAGVKDMRFQALMPDVLHWLGITKIDRMLSMSNMKHDAIVEQGIPIHERVPIPDEMIPADSRVEIDAKIHAGYFTTGKVMTMTELSNVQGRAWDDIDH
ncbi:MAG: putative GTP cyclohydrolase [Watsoniomyces obsoletus]|nr:MAG: putative GTP cyclohydrolase [Watsoniomyces obsoletus]